MIGLGTIINVAAIILGGAIGLAGGKWLTDRCQETLTRSMGKGCLFSAVPVGVFQGSVTLMARLVEPLLTAAALDNLSLVGSALIFCVGVNLIWKNTIRAANLLPALIVAVVYAFTGF